MAGAGGTGKPKGPTIDDLREALIPELLKHLSGPAPTPPQYQPTPISPMQGYAIARNPQAAGLINQTIQAPAQAQYAQQQAAFEQAMGNRQQAMQGAVGLAREGSPLDMARLQETQRHNLAMENKPPNMAFLGSPEGYVAANRRTGEVSAPMRRPDGSIVYPPPPAGVVQGVAASTATLGGLEDLRAAYKKIREQVAGQSVPRQVISQYAGETRLGGALAPEYANYTAARRAALNAYIKAQTGAQFSVKELERYEAQYPEPWDPESVAENKINVLEQRALSDMQAKLRAFPGASGAAPQTRGQYSGVTLHESDFANAKPGERERFIAGGGKVVP